MNKLSAIIIFILLQILILNSCVISLPNNTFKTQSYSENNTNNIQKQNLPNNKDEISESNDIYRKKTLLSFHFSPFTLHLNELIQKVNSAKALKAMSDNLALRISTEINQSIKTTLTQKLTEVNSEWQTIKDQRDDLKDKIITGLTLYKSTLRNKVNTLLLQEPPYSVDDPTKPVNLQGYKDFIWELEDDFLSYVKSENTYGLLDSLSSLADENNLLIDLINDYTPGNYSDAPTIPDPYDELDRLTKPEQVIQYLAKQIDYHKIKFDSENLKLNEELDNTTKELQKATLETQKNIQEALLASMVETGVLNPETFEINNNPSPFTTQSFRIKTNLLGSLVQGVKNSYGTVENFMSKVERPAMEKATRYITGYSDNASWNALPQADRDNLVNTFTEVASSIVPTSPADLLPAGKLFKLAGKTSVASMKMSIKVLKELKNKFPELATKIDNVIEKLRKEISLKCTSCGKKTNVKLKNNIKNADWNHPQKGVKKPAGWESHHIGPEGGRYPEDKDIKEILDNAGIDVADAHNGVNLPRTSVQNKGTEYGSKYPDVTPHKESGNSTTSQAYSRKVNQELQDAVRGIDPVSNPTGYKQAVEGKLGEIREGLLNGTLKW